MVASIIIGGLIFGYAGWAMWKFIHKTKQGKCAGCGAKNSCTTNSCSGTE